MERCVSFQRAGRLHRQVKAAKACLRHQQVRRKRLPFDL